MRGTGHGSAQGVHPPLPVILNLRQARFSLCPSLTQLEAVKPQERLEKLGELLYPLISALHPGDFAGKITNILLSRSSLEMLVDILQDRDLLREEVKLISAGLGRSHTCFDEVPDLTDLDESFDDTDNEVEQAVADLSPPMSLSPTSAATAAGKRVRRREKNNNNPSSSVISPKIS